MVGYLPQNQINRNEVAYVDFIVKGYYFMEEDLKEKEFYRGSILGLIENIDNVEILSYIHTIISDIIEDEG